MMKTEEELTRIALLLDEIELELRRLGYWQGDAGCPDAQAFCSTVPFCLDTMEFQQWLEYVLIARLRELMSKDRPLPERMLTAPMAQEVWRGRWNEHKQLIMLLKRLDERFGR